MMDDLQNTEDKVMYALKQGLDASLKMINTCSNKADKMKFLRLFDKQKVTHILTLATEQEFYEVAQAAKEILEEYEQNSPKKPSTPSTF